jgi:MraZ protein
MSNPLSKSSYFTGEFRHKLDGANRLKIPSKWSREQGTEYFLRVHPTHQCLIAMTSAEVESTLARAREKLEGEKLANFLRSFGSRILLCTVDKQGRLLLTEDQCREAKLKGDVLCVGMVSRFEIWNPKAWAKQNETLEEEVSSIVGL